MLSNKLKEIRRKANITQKQLADKTDVRRETIIRLEKNLYNPSLELAFKIANVLNCDINVIFQYSNDKDIQEPDIVIFQNSNDKDIQETDIWDIWY